MAPHGKQSETVYSIVTITAVVLGIYFSGHYAYVLFHGLVEVVSIAIAFAMFVLVWNTRAYMANNYLWLLGVGYAFSAFIDLLHTFSFQGMTVFTGYGDNLAPQLWLAARYLQTATLVAAPLVIKRALDQRFVFSGYAMAVVGFLVLVYTGHFPDCIIAGKGLTPFKKDSEYVISGLLIVSLYLLSRKRSHFSDRIYWLIVASVSCTIISELMFTAFISMYDFTNKLGHIAKLVAFYLVYRAILVTGLKEPFEVVFRTLKQTEQDLREHQETLEERVRERTAQLELEIAERKRAEETLQRLNRELRAISDCNLALMKAEDEQTLLNDICRIICDKAGYRLAWVGYPEQDDAKTLRMAAWGGLDDGYLENAHITWADTERGRGPGGTAIRTGTTTWTQDFAADPLAAPWRENALQRGYRSCICLPLKNEKAGVFGALGIYSTEPNAFTPDEIRLLEELAGDLAFGIQALRNRDARRESERDIALLSFALNSVHEAAYLIDEQAHFLYVNEESCRVLGYGRDELLALGVLDIGPYFPVERWVEHWAELKSRRSLTFEEHHKTKDGRIFPVEISANYLEYDGQGYNLALVRDITGRKKAEESLRHSEARLNEAQRIAHLGNWELDLASNTLLWSDEIYRIFEIDRELFGASYDAFLGAIHPDDRELVNRAYTQSLADRTPYGIVHRLLMKDGRIKYVEERCETFYAEDGRPLGSMGTVQDITGIKLADEALHLRTVELEAEVAERQAAQETLQEQALLLEYEIEEHRNVQDELEKLNESLEQHIKERTIELERANARLQELDRMKSMFIASMSHELRTPLNSIIGFSRIMFNEWAGPLNNEQRDNIEAILRSGNHLLSLINDVIDVSKIEAGMIDVMPEEFDVHDIVSEAVLSFGNDVAAKGVEFKTQVIHHVMHTDRTRLLQCLLNLISNAAKFTEKGAITISAKVPNGAGTLELSVADTGIGIQEEDLGKLFFPFVRLNSPLTSTVPGTGLGLYLTRKLAREVLQGDLTVTSTPYVGSRFVLSVPINL